MLQEIQKNSWLELLQIQGDYSSIHTKSFLETVNRYAIVFSVEYGLMSQDIFGGHTCRTGHIARNG